MNEIKALIADLAINGAWKAEKIDKTITAEVAAKHNLVGSPGKYVKELFPKATCGTENPYTRWLRANYWVRKYWSNHTSPWEDGRRIVSAAFSEKFMRQIQAHIEEAIAAFERFIEWFPEGLEKANSPDGLNGLYNFGDYPSVEQLRQFKIMIRLYPIPQGHHFITGLAKSVIDNAVAQIQGENEERIKRARANIWQEALDPIERMAETLNKPGAPKFWDSLVSNVREVADRIPALDFDGSPELAALRQRINILTDGLDADQLRNDPLLRAEVGTAAGELVRTFGTYSRKLS